MVPPALAPPLDDLSGRWSEAELAGVEQALSCSFIGSPGRVRRGIHQFLTRTKADELILTAQIFDHAARLRSFEIAAQVRSQLMGSGGGGCWVKPKTSSGPRSAIAQREPVRHVPRSGCPCHVPA